MSKYIYKELLAIEVEQVQLVALVLKVHKEQLDQLEMELNQKNISNVCYFCNLIIYNICFRIQITFTRINRRRSY